MVTKEGIVKYQLDYLPGHPVNFPVIASLNAWRKILFMANLVGQDVDRYGGAGYGNVSQRLERAVKGTQPRFAISGTQTGGLVELTADHYAIVTETWPEENRVVATGPIMPSSESLTHGMLYVVDQAANFILHAHSPEIWQNASALGIPTTSASVAYGTPEMAEEVRRLFRDTPVRERKILCMGGHTDGVMSFSRTAEEAGCVMMAYLARALAL